MAIVPQDFKKTIAFIFSESDEPVGTGFWIGVPLKGNQACTYLVTSRHVFDDVQKVKIRLNSKDGKLFNVNYNFNGKKNRPLYHKDPAVDLVLLPITPPQKTDLKLLPQELICDDDLIVKNQVTEGDEIFFAGLFPTIYGNLKNTPIVRRGSIALLTDEPFEIENGTESEYIFLDATSFPGNSGSPVFLKTNSIQLSDNITKISDEIYILGVVRGYIDHPQEVSSGWKNAEIGDNMGITIATPGKYIKEILNSKKAIKIREKIMEGL